MSPAAVVLAHGVGSRQDLPLPFGLALAGAVAALVVSFVALGVLWHEPRLDGPSAGRPLPRGVQRVLDSRVTRAALAVLGLAATAYVGLALVVGADTARNPAPFVVYVLLWVGLVPLSVLFGPVWRLVNPLRGLHGGVMRAARLDPREGAVRLPAGVGYWPAAAGLLAFTWLELVAPDNTSLATLRLAVGVYAVVHLLAAFVLGSGWFDRGDAFEVWSDLYGRLSVLGRRADGRLVLRSPLAGLDALPPAPGLAATVAVMLGSTAYDGLSNAPAWFTITQSSALPEEVVSTLGLVGACLLVWLLYAAATAAAGRLGGLGVRGMPSAFAHSVVPIALGYVVAHYWSLLVLEGQRGLMFLTDPLGNGSDWLGLADRAPDTRLLDPTLVSSVQVLAIVAGHVLGVVLAHDRAVRLFPRRRAVLGQLPLLALMVVYTCTGLLLLFSA